MTQIIPSILATTETEYLEQLKEIEESTAFEGGIVQIDLMDGEFVPNKSIGVEILKKNPPKLDFEVHLMVKDPNKWVEQLKDLPVKRFFIHIEDEQQAVDEVIANLQALTNCQTGVAINPETDLEKVKPFLDTVDAVLLMSVHPGFQGQEFIPETLKKVRELKEIDPEMIIEVDGGINAEKAKELVDAGADNLVIGSHLLKGEIDENIEKIWEKINS